MPCDMHDLFLARLNDCGCSRACGNTCSPRTSADRGPPPARAVVPRATLTPVPVANVSNTETRKRILLTKGTRNAQLTLPDLGPGLVHLSWALTPSR